MSNLLESFQPRNVNELTASAQGLIRKAMVTIGRAAYEQRIRGGSIFLRDQDSGSCMQISGLGNKSNDRRLFIVGHHVGKNEEKIFSPRFTALQLPADPEKVDFSQDESFRKIKPDFLKWLSSIISRSEIISQKKYQELSEAFRAKLEEKKYSRVYTPLHNTI